MVALVRSIISDEPQAIHRTALTPDGRKADLGDVQAKKMLGPRAGGVIKLTQDADAGRCLGLGEGIETTMSLREHPDFAGVPVWAAICADGLRHFPVLAGIESLIIAVDMDESAAGQSAAAELCQRYEAAGICVTTVAPPRVGLDLNDLLLGRDE
jgi:hypothetical protein